MNECTIRIQKAKNGYTVCLTDPEIVKANRAPSKPGKPYKPYRDPEVKYVFEDVDEVLAFLKKALPKAVVETDEYGSSFDEAAKVDNDD